MALEFHMIFIILYSFLTFFNKPCVGFTITIPLKQRLITITTFNNKHNNNNNKNKLHMSVPTPIDTLTSGLASIVRFPYGTTILPRTKIRKEVESITILKLYDIENNPKCRLVRECISELDLNIIEVIPCAGSNNDDGDSAIVPVLH